MNNNEDLLKPGQPPPPGGKPNGPGWCWQRQVALLMVLLGLALLLWSF